MTDNDPKKKAAAADRLEAEADAILAAAGESPWFEGGEEAASADPASMDPAADIVRLEAEKADLTDRLVRLAADMDNLRKRTERDAQDARKYAVTKFAGDMLVVGDNLKRALEAVPAEKKEEDEALKALVDGVEMTGREMDRLLEKNGITKISALGERFDPHRHQAMFEVSDPSVPAGTVVQVMQEGYQIGDRVLRAAMVGVSKDGPSPYAEAGRADAPESSE
jgi:molecular chaperone GrpE